MKLRIIEGGAGLGPAAICILESVRGDKAI